jgi:hypothetical protein
MQKSCLFATFIVLFHILGPMLSMLRQGRIMDQTWVYFLMGFFLLAEKIKTYEKSDYKDISILTSKFKTKDPDSESSLVPRFYLQFIHDLFVVYSGVSRFIRG